MKYSKAVKEKKPVLKLKPSNPKRIERLQKKKVERKAKRAEKNNKGERLSLCIIYLLRICGVVCSMSFVVFMLR